MRPVNDYAIALGGCQNPDAGSSAILKDETPHCTTVAAGVEGIITMGLGMMAQKALQPHTWKGLHPLLQSFSGLCSSFPSEQQSSVMQHGSFTDTGINTGCTDSISITKASIEQMNFTKQI